VLGERPDQGEKEIVMVRLPTWSANPKKLV
jgi:hypothetical protein